MKPILFIFLSLTYLLFACNSKSSSPKKNFKHTYSKYWEKYSEKELKDKIMTKPGLHKEDSKKLLAELKKDGTKINRLYPMTDFDEVTVSNGKIARKKRFNHVQTARLLSIVNDPTSFNWSKMTSKPDIQVAFLKNGEMVAVLNIQSDKLIVKPSPELPGFLKMKLGTLNAEPRQKLVDLFAEIGC